VTRQPSPQNRDAAQHLLGNSVAVYLDGEPTAAAVASSIVDVTGPFPFLKRAGAISAERPSTVIPDLRDGSRPGLVREQGGAPCLRESPVRRAS
jgi:tRNA A37 threonylcarbamoyladenosine synthetase subunit TsaC/SUA5/YrdC